VAALLRTSKLAALSLSVSVRPSMPSAAMSAASCASSLSSRAASSALLLLGRKVRSQLMPLRPASCSPARAGGGEGGS
jgi:hypothetical protein